jgi:hypothetical protein
MSFQELIDTISEVQDQTVFVRFEPEVLDFTDKESPKELIIYLQNNKVINVPIKDDLFFLISMLKVSLFSKGMKILCWNWKSFSSYILSKTGGDYFVGGSIIDLKILESYLGKKNKAPKDIKEALTRLKQIISDGSWKSVENVYKNLHIPLITTVIPHLENSGVIDTSKGSRVFANYDIDGQDNGRLLCSNSFKKGFVPHAMGPDVRSVLRPIGFDEYFMSFDFRAMEVYMLSWLSKDPVLDELCKSKDVYCSLYEKILEKPPEKKSDRDFVKKCFLPVIYGQSPYSLGQRCGIPKDDAVLIVNRINSLFSVAVDWVCSQEYQLKNNGFSRDYFGKRRYFDEGKEYLVRNFCVQSPAAVVCLEKLCHLSFALKSKTSISFMVHDSYTVYFNKENWREIYNISEQILLGESSFCSNLKLKFSCRIGKNLNELKLFKPRESLDVGNMQ